jgi:hypothetical protein
LRWVSNSVYVKKKKKKKKKSELLVAGSSEMDTEILTGFREKEKKNIKLPVRGDGD